MTPATKKRRAKPRRKPRRQVDPALTESQSADKLNDELRLVVVQRLAMYDTPQEIADDVKQEYSVEISRQGIQSYDPTVGRKPSAKWCAIFEATRKKFLEDTAAAAPIALKSVRLRRLDRVCVRAAKSGNAMMVLASSEQAAKEMGDLYTNRRNVGGVVGHLNLDDLTEEQLQHIANGGSVADLPR
jgi:hypothetical protein